jgi:hypothetical protein
MNDEYEGFSMISVEGSVMDGEDVDNVIRVKRMRLVVEQSLVIDYKVLNTFAAYP